MTSNEKPAPATSSNQDIYDLEIKYEKEIKEISNWNNWYSELLKTAIHDCKYPVFGVRKFDVNKLEEYIVFCLQHQKELFELLDIKNQIDKDKVVLEYCPSLKHSFNMVSQDFWIVSLGLGFHDFKSTVEHTNQLRRGYQNYQSNKDKFAQIKGKYEQWKNDNKNMEIYISSISGENLLKPPEEYDLLLKKVELQLEKVPKILEQQKQLEFDSDLYKLADEILSGGIRDADYETYKNKVEEFEQKFEEFNKNQDLKNDDNKLDDEKELHEDEIGNDNDGGTLENENVSEEKSDDSNSECSNGGVCNCLKNILWYRVFLYLSLLSLLLLIISVYCLIVTAIFLLASLVLYFIQKTKKDNDGMEVMAENLSSEINQEQSKNLISIDKDHSNNVKQQNEFSLFERAND
ncbi:MAG: hypothetical protein IJU86_01920 [Firmicutes bacterium]|nr:hypothetical protein [Bacillota bacterium]